MGVGTYGKDSVVDDCVCLSAAHHEFHDLWPPSVSGSRAGRRECGPCPARCGPGDVVLLDSYYSYIVLTTFANRAGLDNQRIYFTLDPVEAAQTVSGHDLWAVSGRTGQSTTNPSPDEFRRRLMTIGQPLFENAVGRYIVVWRLRAPNKPVS